MVTIQRRLTRMFSISIPEAAELVDGLLHEAPELAEPVGRTLSALGSPQ